MRTSTPLVYAPPPSARKSPYKRRRLNQVIDSGCQPGRALTDNSNVVPTPNAPSLSVCAKLSCSTCHRALSTATRPGVASPSTCSRCVAFSFRPLDRESSGAVVPPVRPNHSPHLPARLPNSVLTRCLQVLSSDVRDLRPYVHLLHPAAIQPTYPRPYALVIPLHPRYSTRLSQARSAQPQLCHHELRCLRRPGPALRLLGQAQKGIDR